MGKVFGSEIRFYLKFRFRDNERKTGNDFDTEGKYFNRGFLRSGYSNLCDRFQRNFLT